GVGVERGARGQGGSSKGWAPPRYRQPTRTTRNYSRTRRGDFPSAQRKVALRCILTQEARSRRRRAVRPWQPNGVSTAQQGLRLMDTSEGTPGSEPLAAHPEPDTDAAAPLPESPALDDAALAEAVPATPARVAPARAAPELPPTAESSPPTPSAHAAAPAGRLIPTFFWPATFLLLVILAAVFVYPMLLARWRSVEGQAEAEAAYQKRRAELRAEAEAATQMLEVLDKRINLVSLGFREVVRKVTPNVVNVTNFRELDAKKGGEAKGHKAAVYFDPDTERHYRQLGVGSGIIVRPGQILTNYHVVRGADRLRVTFSSGQSVSVNRDKNVVADAATDLAVLRLPADLPCGLCEDLNVTTEFADSDRDVHRGDLVLALGSPLGLKQTVTHGIISAKGRLLDKITLVELLQTDAAINPGNSGGPLFDQYGRLARINLALASHNPRNHV